MFAVVVALLAYAFSLLFIKYRPLNFLWATVATWFFFNFGGIRVQIIKLHSASDKMISLQALILSCLVLVTLAIIWHKSKPRWAPTATFYLNIFVLILVGWFGLKITSMVISNLNVNLSSTKKDVLAQRASKKPDMDFYYFIFDRYASQPSLEQRFKDNNQDFLARLEQKGFKVASNSHANYPFTLWSVASTLNANYLSPQSSQVKGNAWNVVPVQQLIAGNAVGQFFRQHGYSYINLGSWWGPTRATIYSNEPTLYGRTLTVLGNTHTMSTFSQFVYEMTPLPIVSKVAPKPQGFTLFESLRQPGPDKIFYDQVAKFKDITKSPQPKFVFVHMLMPHPPYVFDKDGRPAISKLPEEQQYVGQLDFTNTKILEMVHEIQSSPRKAAIVLAADEGPYPPNMNSRDSMPAMTDWMLQQKFGILNAFYLPGVDVAKIPSSTTPVNTFRLILNNYFGTNLKLLPDKSYVYKNDYHPYDFIDITKRLYYGGKIPSQ